MYLAQTNCMMIQLTSFCLFHHPKSNIWHHGLRIESVSTQEVDTPFIVINWSVIGFDSLFQGSFNVEYVIRSRSTVRSGILGVEDPHMVHVRVNKEISPIKL